MSYNYNQRNFYRPSMFGGFSFFPLVIKWLMITNAVVFVLMNFFGSFTLDGYPLAPLIYQYFALLPFGDGFLPWQLITYQFMHAGIMHLLFNMFFGLWMFGMEIEHLWGPKKFLLFYLMCGVVAGIAQLVLAPVLDRPSMVIGASGAVYGVLVAFGMMFPDRYIYLYFLIPVKVKYFVIVLIVLGLFSLGQPTDVANLAHLGGALAGYVYLLFDMRRVPGHAFFQRVGWWWNGLFAPRPEHDDDVIDAKVFDINEGRTDDRSGEKKNEHAEVQKRIDEILDKIGRSGYQNLTEEEKKILFEASKKLN
ncbi:MAG TPA: rhomboid family intramembrane serine protease [Bacteroidota bacterium]|nr:rhomboid family intramembrane serine protease [Bacteroidota bacterium]